MLKRVSSVLLLLLAGNDALPEEKEGHTSLLRNVKTKHHHGHLGANGGVLMEGDHGHAHDQAASAAVASKAVRGILVAKETAHVLEKPNGAKQGHHSQHSHGHLDLVHGSVVGESNHPSKMEIRPDGVVAKQRKHGQNKKKKVKCVEAGSKDRSCAHFSGRFRPRTVHHTVDMKLNRLAFGVGQIPQLGPQPLPASSVATTVYPVDRGNLQAKVTPGNSSIPNTPFLSFTPPTPFYQYLPLPSKVTCQMAVDDTLLGISYNGIPIPGQIAGARPGVVPGTLPTEAPLSYQVGTVPPTASMPGNDTPTPICPGLMQFSFTPVPGAGLYIFAQDSIPGSGSMTCSGIGLVCYGTYNITQMMLSVVNTSLTATYTAAFASVPQNDGMATIPYDGINNYMSWSIAGGVSQPPILFTPKDVTFPISSNTEYGGDNAGPYTMNLVGPGSSSSAACGIDPSLMPIIMWQDGSQFVTAAWTTPFGTSTTTTLLPNTTVPPKSGTVGSGPNMLKVLLTGLFVYFIR